MQGYVTTPEKVSCEGCGLKKNTTQSIWGEYLCPACMTQWALTYAALDHLKLLLTSTMTEWLETWQAHPSVTAHLESSAGAVAGEVAATLLADRSVRRNLKLKKIA